MIRGSDVTVVIPTIEGREALLDRALESIKSQQVQPGDVVVHVDKDRLGAAPARNAALEHVTTSWLAWLDDDDEFLPNHIKVLVRGANRSGADMVYSYAEFNGGPDVTATSDDEGNVVPRPINVQFGPWQAMWLRNRGNWIPVTYLARTALVKQVGGFPAPYSFEHPQNDCEDLGLLLRLLEAGAKFHHVCGVRTWRYNFHDANLGGRGHDRMHELGG